MIMEVYQGSVWVWVCCVCGWVCCVGILCVCGVSDSLCVLMMEATHISLSLQGMVPPAVKRDVQSLLWSV